MLGQGTNNLTNARRDLLCVENLISHICVILGFEIRHYVISQTMPPKLSQQLKYLIRRLGGSMIAQKHRKNKKHETRNQEQGTRIKVARRRAEKSKEASEELNKGNSSCVLAYSRLSSSWTRNTSKVEQRE